MQLAGSMAAYLDNIPVARNIASDQMTVGRHVILAIPQGNPKDACVIAVWDGAAGGGGPGGGGASTFLDLTDTPASFAGQAGKSAVVNTTQDALEFAQRAALSSANRTIYVDKAATGSGDGTSWADAFTTIMAAVDSIENIVIHDYVIKVRKGATPYRETVYLNSDPANHPTHIIVGSLTIEAEYSWQGDCEANVGGAGEIVDTGAFADVAVGDKVVVLDLNGANGRCQNYELCTVDNVSNKPNRIGTDGTKTPTTGWIYWIVRTEISGSDNGTDGGTARDNILNLNGIANVTITGFYLTFSDKASISGNICGLTLNRIIAEKCDEPLNVSKSDIAWDYILLEYDTAGWGHKMGLLSQGTIHYAVFIDSSGLVNREAFSVGEGSVCLQLWYAYFVGTKRALGVNRVAYCRLGWSTIPNTFAIGIKAEYNAAVWASQYVTNNATTPKDPAGTTEGAYIS